MRRMDCGMHSKRTLSQCHLVDITVFSGLYATVSFLEYTPKILAAIVNETNVCHLPVILRLHT